MTTVAHADGVIASDSRFTFEMSGHQIDNLVSKVGLFSEENRFYGMAGRADFMALCHDYATTVQAIDLDHLKIIFDQRPAPGKDDKVTFEMIIHESGTCYKHLFIQKLGFKLISTDNYQIAGSGGEFAIEYLTSTSSDPVEAVEYAISKDPYSGGDIMATKEHDKNAVLTPFMIEAGKQATQYKELEAKMTSLHAQGHEGIAYAAVGKYSQEEIEHSKELSAKTKFGSYDEVVAAKFLDEYTR